MSIFGRMMKSIRADLALSDPKAWSPSLWNLIGSQAISGENVTEQTALTYSAVWNAIIQIGGSIGSLPLHLMQQKGEVRRMATDNAMYRVMHDEWNPYMTAMTGREVYMAHLLTWGNGYAEIVRDGYGAFRQLWPIPPNRIRPKMVDGVLFYIVDVDNQQLQLRRDQILHTPGLGYDGFMGYGVISMARKSIGLGMAMETFGSLFFGQGTHPGTIISHPGTLSGPGHKNLESSLVTAYSGLGNTHRLMLLEEGMKVEKWGIPPNDCQFLESRQFQIPEICRWFNIQPHKLKDLTRSSFSNIEAENGSFVIDCLRPWCERLEQNYAMQLLSKTDKEQSGRGRLYWKHNLNALLRGDTAARGTYYSTMFNIGALSQNEIRALEDMNPIKNGDKHYVQLSMQAVEDVGKLPEQGELELVEDDETDTEDSGEKKALPPPSKRNGGNGLDKRVQMLLLTEQ